MAYQVIKSQAKRRDDRALDLEGMIFKPVRHTIGQDRKLRPLREKAGDLYREIAQCRRDAAGLDDDLEPLAEQPTPEAKRKAAQRAQKLEDDLLQVRCELIVASLGKSENDDQLTVDLLLEKLEIADIDAYEDVLFGSATPTLPDPPTGDSDAD